MREIIIDIAFMELFPVELNFEDINALGGHVVELANLVC
jgi:hypothetical protein